jgi:glycosyltransferase involved in cell wall biosynthesis
MAKILIVEAAHNLGGSLTSVEIVIRWGQKQGMQFSFMSALKGLEDVLPPSVDLYDLPTQKKYPLPKYQYLRYVAQQYGCVIKRLWSDKCDVLLLNNSLNSNIPALLAGLSRGKPIVQFIREFERESRLWRWLSSRVDAYVAVSKAIRDNLLDLGVVPEKIVLAPEGFSPREPATTEQKLALRRQLGISQDARIMGFVGRLDWWKGYALFIEAAMLAVQEDPKLYAIMVGGAAAGQEKRIKSMKQKIAKAGLEDRVILLGEVAPSKVEALVRGMDVFLHTSIEPEPFGRVLLEAMAVGVPVISSSEGGPREIIVDRESGLLTRPHDCEALVDAVRWLFDCDDRLHQMGINARLRVLEHFGESVCAAPVLDLINRLTAKG